MWLKGLGVSVQRMLRVCRHELESRARSEMEELELLHKQHLASAVSQLESKVKPIVFFVINILCVLLGVDSLCPSRKLWLHRYIAPELTKRTHSG